MSLSLHRTRRMTLVIASLASGGAERVLSILASRWSERGNAITIVTLDGSVTRPFYPLHEGVSLVALDVARVSVNPIEGAWNNIRRLAALRKALRRSAPDVVVSFMDTTNVLVLIATRGSGIPVVVSERIDPAMQKIGRAWRFLRRLVYPWAHRVVMQNERSSAYFAPYLSHRLTIIPNPVPSPVSLPISVSGDVSVPTRRFLAMGRLTPQKGFDLLLKAFAQLAPRLPEWSLVIYGEGECRGDLEALAFSLKIDERVMFPGRTDKPAEAMRSASVFVLSSRFEGFPNVLCEAMALGLAVVATDCPSGPGDIVSHEENGLLVPPGEVNSLAAAMARLARDEELRARLGNRAKDVAARFSEEKVLQAWDSIWPERDFGTDAQSAR